VSRADVEGDGRRGAEEGHGEDRVCGEARHARGPAATTGYSLGVRAVPEYYNIILFEGVLAQNSGLMSGLHIP
jgi:hypothetical protein